MLKKWYILCLGIISVFSTPFVLSYDMYCGCDGADYGIFGARAEYLFWKTQICDLEFAREYLASTGSSDRVRSILASQDTTHRASYKWCSGFRIGADYQCSYDDPWKYNLVYTYFRSRDSDKVMRKESEIEGQMFFLFPVIPFADTFFIDLDLCDEITLTSIGDRDLIDAAKTHTRFRIDLGDLEIIRETPLCGPACFNIVLGIRGGYLSNRWTTKYQFPDRPFFGNQVEICADLVNNWRFSTIGPRIGGQFDWCLGCGFTIYLDASLSTLWGKMRNRAFTKFNVNTVCSDGEPDGFSIIAENQHHRCYKAVLMADGQLGVAFNWDSDCFAVQGKVGIELVHFNSLSDHIFHAFPQGLSSGKEYRNGNIDLYGLTAGLSILF